jgi:hypothetical protein
MDFILGLTKPQRHDSMLVVVDIFSNMAHSILCKKTNDATHVVVLFFQEIVRLHGLPRSINSNIDTRFLGHIWRILWKNMGSRLHYSSTYHP